jgi:hypothetical protein
MPSRRFVRMKPVRAGGIVAVEKIVWLRMYLRLGTTARGCRGSDWSGVGWLLCWSLAGWLR